MRLTSHSQGPIVVLVEIVDVEDEAAIGSFEGAEILHVSVAADLRPQAGRRHGRQIGRHQRHRAAKEAEGRSRHARILDGQQTRDARAIGVDQQRDNVELALLGVPFALADARNLVAQRAPKLAALFARLGQDR